MSKMFHIYINYLLSNTSWHTADIPENSEILGKNCEEQSKWNLYLQLIGLTLIVSKTGTSCQVSKEIGRGKKIVPFTLVL